MISERLKQRIANLTGDSGMQVVGPTGALSNYEPRLIDGPLPEGMVPSLTQTAEFRDVNQNGIEDRAEGIYRPEDLVPESTRPQLTEAQKELQRRFYTLPSEGGFLNRKRSLSGMSAEDKETLESLLQRAEEVSMAPLSEIAQELAMQGEGEDTQLAHLRPGEVVLPPEFFEDEKFESAVERKFKEFDLNPEQAIVGTGIASLNPMTGLEQFGFFKKIGKSLKKIVKKVAPVAAFIPGVGTALGGVLGGVAGKVGGALGLKGTLAKKVLGGIGGLNIPGISNIAGGAAGGFGSLKGLGSLSGMLKGGPLEGLLNQQQATTDEIIGTSEGKPITKADIKDMTQEQIANMQLTPAAAQDKTFMQQLSAMFLPQSVEDALGTGPGGGGLGSLFGQGQGQDGDGLFGGNFGDALKMGGIGALAAGLGKLAYEDAKKQTGVPLTPLTTMSPTGRYNIEAEIARRMGQPAPNPVEFGLLPEGTLPELSGGKPAGMMYGGPVMAYAQGGAVQMQEGGEMDPNMFPRMDGDINGPGTETSDDIPAMLSDGEFVMTSRAVRGAGAYEIQSGGDGIISLIPSLNEDRERGMDNMYKMMDTFANRAEPST
tara:strand:+ start:136 stop:1932 length:1797 start_codon:yes stop_codon:yes gene_type:complete